MTSIPEQLKDATAVVASVACTAASVGSLTDSNLVESLALAALLCQASDLHTAALAAEVAQRSRYELGTSRLSSREGHEDATAMIQATLKSTKGEAARSIQVGTLLADTEASSRPDSPAPVQWHAPLGRAVLAGILTGAGAASIQRGLGKPCERVSEADLTAACEQIILENSDLNSDQLFNLARSTRDEIDSAGVALREEERNTTRFFKSSKAADGMYTGSWRLPPETGMLIDNLWHRMVGSRGGGPRFVSETDAARDLLLENDPRTAEQIAADEFHELMVVAVDADSGTVLGERRPSVRVLVPIDALTSGIGHGYLEGHPDAISIGTISRMICDTGTYGAMFLTDGALPDVGRDQRLFTARQRIGLATKWGGCAHPECDRAAWMCEAHHINEWTRDLGRTDVADGIMLGRRHHKLVHDNNERVIRDGNEYWLTKRAPEPGCPGSAATQYDGGTLSQGATVPPKRILLRSKNPLINTIMRNATRQTAQASQRETALSRT